MEGGKSSTIGTLKRKSPNDTLLFDKPTTCEYVRCKLCGSENTVKAGTFRMMQYYWCKSCQHRFAANDALPGMKTATVQIAVALFAYYEGVSLDRVREELSKIYDIYFSDSTIHHWIERFSKKAVEYARAYTPSVGDVWIADETELTAKIGGGEVWAWDIMDSDTKLLLASHITETRLGTETRRLMEEACEWAGKTPKVVLTSKMSAYFAVIKPPLGMDKIDVQSLPLPDVMGSNLIECSDHTLSIRTQVMRGIKKLESARLLIQGWRVYYNFLRRSSKYSITPAEKAGVKYPWRHWWDLLESEYLQPL
jgi:putative transposase